MGWVTGGWVRVGYLFGGLRVAGWIIGRGGCGWVRITLRLLAASRVRRTTPHCLVRGVQYKTLPVRAAGVLLFLLLHSERTYARVDLSLDSRFIALSPARRRSLVFWTADWPSTCALDRRSSLVVAAAATAAPRAPPVQESTSVRSLVRAIDGRSRRRSRHHSFVRSTADRPFARALDRRPFARSGLAPP